MAAYSMPMGWEWWQVIDGRIGSAAGSHNDFVSAIRSLEERIGGQESSSDSLSTEDSPISSSSDEPRPYGREELIRTGALHRKQHPRGVIDRA